MGSRVEDDDHARSPCSPNGLMNGDQFGPVGEGGFGLDLVDHLRDALHHVASREDGRAKAHEISDRSPIARAFQNLVGDDGDRFRVVQLQPPFLTPAREVGGDHDEKFFLVAR